MPPKSRYTRAIEASKQVARAAAMAGTISSAKSHDDKQVILESILGQLRTALVNLDAVIEQCSMARGMYLTNPTIRNTLVNAGEYLAARQPKIATQINDIIAARKDPSHDWSGLHSSLTSLAMDIAGVSFDPALTTTP